MWKGAVKTERCLGGFEAAGAWEENPRAFKTAF